MPIYTRTGDDGTTSLFGGKRILKSDLLIKTYGTIDELSSFLGLLFFHIKKQSDKKNITQIQKDLHLIMGFLAGAPIDLPVLSKHITQFEKEIDLLEKKLPVLHHFILPQGSLVSTYAHICRTACRKAERTIVIFFAGQKKQDNLIIPYLNRLSDYLFIKAREYNQNNKREIKV